MSLPFSVAGGGCHRHIRYVVLSCAAVVMVGAMVLTTYTASAESSATMSLKYNAEARAKVKAYYKALRYCYTVTDSIDDLLVYHALSGKWGTDSKEGNGDVGINFKDDFLAGIRGLENDKGYDCSEGNLIKEAFDYFADVSGSKPWSQWTLDEKKDLFCGSAGSKSGWFKAAYDETGTNDYEQDCRSNVDFVAANQGDFDKITNYAFVKTSMTNGITNNDDEEKGLKHLETYLVNNIFNNDVSIDLDNSGSYADDELFYVYRGLIAKQCSVGKTPSNYDPMNDHDDYIAAIKFVSDGNALRMQKQWWPKEKNHATLLFNQSLSCKDTIESGVGDPTKGYVGAARSTLVDYYKDDCLGSYEAFYDEQSDYKNRLTEPNEGDYENRTDYDGAKLIYDAYIAWFDALPLPETLRKDGGFCIDNGIYVEQEWPNNPIFECRLDEYVDEILSTNPDQNSPGWSGYTISGLTNDDDDVDSVKSDPCYQSAGSLGWALCPIMSGLSNTLTSIYEDMVEPFLAVNPRLLGAEAKKVVDDVTVFANAAIIIFLLMVIFSQLTGVGIDNYGIKKSLPKLIVTAVLVNLSFVICQVAVDLSNVVGSGANSMLAGVDVTIDPCHSREKGVINGVTLRIPGGQEECVPADISSGSEAGTFKTMVNIASVGLVGIGVGSIALGIASSGWLAGLIIPIFLLLITAVIAVLFFFVLLGVRQAGVVILAVLSPLALACYMLPNTKRFFDKWKKAFTGLLVLYPICGLLIGGGQLAAKILISASQDYVTYFAGCLIMVVPFFFIPSLLKGSFAAMGNIGAKISGIGRSLGSRGRGRMDGAIKNSDRYKNRVKYNQDRAALRRANRTIRRLNRRSGGDANNLSRRQQARMGAAVDTVLAQRKGERGNTRKSGQAYFAAMQHKQDLEDASEARAVEQYNDPNYRAAREISLSEEARRQRSKDRTALALDRYREDGLAQLGQRWERAFRDGNVDELDALTNVMTQRYGTSAANSIGQILSRMHDVNGNENYRRSLRALQQTMGDNSTFAGNMKAKASDAFQMISDAGTVYDNGALEYHDLDYFSEHNNTSSDIKDWSTQSADTLRRAIASGALRTDMIEEILNSTDPSVRSGIQSDRNKRDLLQAALYNRQHNPSGMGPNLTDAQAAQNYRQAESDRQAESELYVRQELAAERRGRTTITVTPGSTVMGTPPVTFEGYAVPSGFNTGGAAPVQNANGEWIYTDATNNRRWNASTGLYEA